MNDSSAHVASLLATFVDYKRVSQWHVLEITEVVIMVTEISLREA